MIPNKQIAAFAAWCDWFHEDVISNREAVKPEYRMRSSLFLFCLRIPVVSSAANDQSGDVESFLFSRGRRSLCQSAGSRYFEFGSIEVNGSGSGSDSGR